MLQAICNKILSLDPDIHLRIAPLQGKNIAIVCSDHKIAPIYMNFENSSILLSSSTPANVDVYITGALKDFIRFAVFKDRKALQISGDAIVAGLLEKLYLHLDIDWEEELSKRTGDVVAYQAMTLFRQVKYYAQNSLASLGEMTAEYLQEETEALVTPDEVEQFMHEVDELRLRVDRLAARIEAYESN